MYCLILRGLPLKGWKALKHGGVAQLGEHLPCKQGVDSSILFISTTVGRNGDTNGHVHGLIAQVVRAHA